MAFATSNVSKSIAGNRNVLEGNWTGSVGDASGTLSIASAHVLDATFLSQDADNPKELVPVDISYSNGIATLTVHNHMDVTKGSFRVVYG